MSATILRWCAVPLGLLAFAMRLAASLWWRPSTWPLPPVTKTERHLHLYRRPQLNSQHHGPSEAIPIGWLDIDPVFLAAAIRHYVDHPEDRHGGGPEPARQGELSVWSQVPEGAEVFG